MSERAREIVMYCILAAVIFAVLGWALYATAYENGRDCPRWDNYDVTIDLDECCIELTDRFGNAEPFVYYFDESIQDEWLGGDGDY